MKMVSIYTTYNSMLSVCIYPCLEHNVLFECCDCEPVAVTMAHPRIWPFSPQHPRLACTFDLMDWVEALLLECHVALKDLCGALLFKCPILYEKVREFIN